MMRRIIIFIAVTFLLTGIVFASEEKPHYRVGIVYGVGNLNAPDSPKFTFNQGIGFAAGLDGRNLLLSFSILPMNNYSDSTASGNFGFFADKNNAELKFSSIRAGFDVDLRIKSRGLFRPFISGGLGYMVWKVKDPVADTIIKVKDGNNNPIDFTAAEMYFSLGLGIEIRPSSKLALNLKTSYDFLTGVGTSFSDSTNDLRGKSMMRANITLSYLFGGGRRRDPLPPVWPSSKSWEEDDTKAAKPKPAERDSDGDGVNDRYDDCTNTPPGAYVDKDGCPTDSDGDGVLDGLDDCPRTSHRAVGYVDIYGCPIDSDYDGVPDYSDNCMDGPEGALVDENGCPTDGDSDGVYDGLDDCPETKLGIEVDRRGCIDVSFLRRPIVVNVDYEPGSFEVDERTKQRLQPLIKKLLILTDVKFKINGYTDNIGPAEANQTVSVRRANRMRDWLITQGISADRMTTAGRGETKFIASNQTSAGRAKNRRLELIFSR
ncbi:MAG: OmpA family protein [candidate division Zixibacteria bacterium]|nr:OmpA family protein [candidate division Zixibacteria bacterium]